MTRRRARDYLAGAPSWPLLLDAAAAAAFLSLKPPAFEHALAQGELPAPRRVAGEIRWSRFALEAHFAPDGANAVPGFDPIAAAIAAA